MWQRSSRCSRTLTSRSIPNKSVFGTNIIEYLGHNVVGQHGIAMNEAKVEAIKALPIPKCIADLAFYPWIPIHTTDTSSPGSQP